MSFQALRDSVAWVKNPHRILDHYLNQGQLSFRFHLLGMGRVFVTGEAALIESAIRNPLLVGGRGTRALRPVVGDDAMIIQEGHRHRAHRSLVTPYFSNAAADRQEHIVIDEAERRLRHVRIGDRFPAMDLFHDINLAIILRVAFGELPASRREALSALINRYGSSFASPWTLFLKPLHIPLGKVTAWGRFTRNRSALRAAIASALQEPNPDTLAAAVSERISSGAISQEEGIDTMLETLLFGHDTAAAALAWWAAYLYSDNEALEQALSEVDAANVRGDAPFIRATLHESMRLSPVVVHLTRVATEQTELGDSQINAGEHVFLCSYMAQRNPQLFEHPQAYFPERFMEKKDAPWSFGYFPFGLGARLCAGISFAMRQMELIAATFLSHGRFCLAQSHPLTPERKLVIMAPRQGLIMSREG